MDAASAASGYWKMNDDYHQCIAECMQVKWNRFGISSLGWRLVGVATLYS
jgi:hypothetical protein